MTSLTPGNPTYCWIQEHGCAWGPRIDTIPAAPRECFINALELALRTPQLHYREGYPYALKINFPFHHARVVSDAGEIVDPTWPDGERYFGVRFGPIYMQRRYLSMLEARQIGSKLDARCSDRDYRLADGIELDWML